MSPLSEPDSQECILLSPICRQFSAISARSLLCLKFTTTDRDREEEKTEKTVRDETARREERAKEAMATETET